MLFKLLGPFFLQLTIFLWKSAIQENLTVVTVEVYFIGIGAVQYGCCQLNVATERSERGERN